MPRLGINMMVVALFALIIILTITGLYSSTQKEGFDSSEPSNPNDRKQLYIETNYGKTQLPSGSGYEVNPWYMGGNRGESRPLSAFTVDKAIYFFPGKKDTGIDVTKRVRDLFKTETSFPIDDKTLQVNMPYPLSPTAVAQQITPQQLVAMRQAEAARLARARQAEIARHASPEEVLQATPSAAAPQQSAAPEEVLQATPSAAAPQQQAAAPQQQAAAAEPSIIGMETPIFNNQYGGQPGGPRPIIINVHNNGGSFGPQGNLGGPRNMNNNNYRIRHELGDNTNQKLDKTVNFLEFIMQKSQGVPQVN